MKIRATALFLTLFLAILWASCLQANHTKAQPRTWVVDDDGPADYQTIREAINHTSDGDIVFVKNGTYYEHIVVSKGISLIGEDREATVIDGNGTGTVVYVAAPGVLLENFTVQNAKSVPGMGCICIYCTLNTIIRQNVLKTGYYGIVLWRDCSNALFTKNQISDVFYGIACEWGSTNISILENHVFSTKSVGISTEGGSKNITVVNNIVENVKGQYTADAIDLWNTQDVLVEDNRISLYSDNGIFISGGCTNIVVDNNSIDDGEEGINVEDAQAVAITGNTLRNQRASNVTGTGITIGSSSGPCTIVGNTMVDNNEAIFLAGGGHTVFHNNFVNNTFQATVSGSNVWDDGYPSSGNYWSDYSGVDLNSGPYQNETGADGLGDTPYTIVDYNVDRYPLMRSQAPHPWLSIDPQIVTATKIGDEFNVTLQINEVDPRIRLTSAQFRLTYNAAMLETRENWAIEGGFLKDSAARANLSTSFEVYTEEGEIVVGIAIVPSSTWPKTAFPVGTGDLVTIRFNVTFQNPAEDTNSTLHVYDTILIDSETVEISVDTQKTEEEGQCLYSISAPTLPSDLNKDRTVDILDIFIVAQAFGATPSDENWNTTADLNRDDTVNILDVFAVAWDFGRTT